MMNSFKKHDGKHACETETKRSLQLSYSDQKNVKPFLAIVFINAACINKPKQHNALINRNSLTNKNQWKLCNQRLLGFESSNSRFLLGAVTQYLLILYLLQLWRHSYYEEQYCHICVISICMHMYLCVNKCQLLSYQVYFNLNEDAMCTPLHHYC